MPFHASIRTVTAAAAAALLVCAGCGVPTSSLAVSGSTSDPAGARQWVGLPFGDPTAAQLLRGRQLVITRDCGACHGGPSPDAEGWLAGRNAENQAYVVDGVRAWAKNLTPDPETGLGRYSHRQVFNALRFGLRPRVSPDVEVTSAIAGQGNHPDEPSYLSPAMPWPSWRRLTEAELWAIVAYLMHGVAPVHNGVREAETPPDGWASWFTEGRIGPDPLPSFPTANEELRDGADLAQILRGRHLAASMGCGECHGGRGNPAADGWLAGKMPPDRRPGATPYETLLQVGPFATYPRNLTPHNTMGLGRFSERQIFNAIRYGLRPGETADVDITSATPGEGNHPRHPKYLPPSMPWSAWRHLGDDEVRDLVAYLKHGLKPVANPVPDSEGPPDFWADFYGSSPLGPYPAAAFPTARENPIR